MSFEIHNGVAPNINIASERPEHRLIMYLVAQGKSQREVAHLTGYSEGWISQVVRQPWFRDRLTQTLDGAGYSVVEEKIRDGADAALDTITELMTSARSESVRASCAFDLLDRHLGKAKQRVDVKNETTIAYKDVQQIEDEINRVRTELSRVGAN